MGAKNMIQPTVGRVVHFYPGKVHALSRYSGPMAAIITHVWNDGMVNVAVFDPNGETNGVTSVELHQPADTPVVHGGFWCEWPPHVKAITGNEKMI